MEMYNPPHPGKVLDELYLKELKISISALALKLGISRDVAESFVNGACPVTAEIVLRLAKAFHTTPELWLDMQQGYDLWHAKQTVNLDDVQAM